MNPKVEKIFYALAIFVLMNAFFILRQSSVPEVSNLQNQVKQQFSIAWQQTIGDQSYFTELSGVYDGITAFYNQSADATIALIKSPDSDADIYSVFSKTFNMIAQVFQKPQQTNAAVASDNQTQKDKNHFNISTPIDSQTQLISGTAIVKPVNQINSWVTIQDNFTGQLYCLAIYNGEVSKYLGPCKSD
jgi:hypothetical protein